MKKLLMWSTIISVLQAVAFFSALYFFGASVKDATLAATAAAALAASVFTLADFSLVAIATASIATSLAIAPTFSATLAAPLFVLAIVFAVFATLAAGAEAKYSTEPFWARFIAALPLGVGTVLGGMLYFFYFRNKTLAFAPRV